MTTPKPPTALQLLAAYAAAWERADNARNAYNFQTDTPRPDGVKARCGGPGVCTVCSLEMSRIIIAGAANATPAPPSPKEPG